MTISARSSDRSGHQHPLTRRAGPRAKLPGRLRRRLNARVVVALLALGSFVAPGVAAVAAALL
jgi:hypothetical protein